MRDKCVGWAKSPDANASGGVPTILESPHKHGRHPEERALARVSKDGHTRLTILRGSPQDAASTSG
jgi:hypothetical protein